jgi:hypothetical protein
MQFMGNSLLRCSFRVFLILVRGLALLVLSIFIVATGMYLRSETYKFPLSIPFQGKLVYNPYDTMPPLRFKANFHAHSRSWGGLTNGHQSDSVLITSYLTAGYHLPSLSNYHRISSWANGRAPMYIPVYESGYNPLKSHLLVMGLNQPSYFDFPLYQNTSHQQQIIQGLRDRGAVLAMAHPDFGGGRRLEDMTRLTGYHFMEVFNHYRHSEKYYDAALSAGRLSWVMSNDDTHDIHGEATFKRWTLLMGDRAEIREVMKRALEGRHYAVFSEDSTFNKSFLACVAPLQADSPDDSVYRRVFRFSHPFDRLQAIGQNGKILCSARNTDTLLVAMGAGESYARVEAIDQNAKLLLNPMVRYNGGVLPLAASLRASPDPFRTWVHRFLILILMVGLICSARWVRTRG